MLHRQLPRRQRPLMLAALVNRMPRCWETRVGEGTDRHRDEIWPGLELPIDGGATVWAEAEAQAVAAVGLAHIGGGFAGDVAHMLALEAGLGAEDVASAALAGVAVADGDADGFAHDGEMQLAAGARRVAIRH